MRYAVIMAGGSGTRLWPLSRKGTPKQLIPLLDGKSLLRVAFERALAVVPAQRVWVVTGRDYAGLVGDLLPELPAGQILGEPVGRDSLNAAAWAAAVISRQDPSAVVAQLTADHVIEPVDAFAEALDAAFQLAETLPDSLVTFGVAPTSPHTGYGYIHKGEPLGEHACRVLEFTEKPSAEVAASYLASGEYWWNSGMFVWRAVTFLEQVATLLPDCHRQLAALAADPSRADAIFPTLPKVSIDYAVMEPVSRGRGSARVVAQELAVTWADVGGFAALAGLFPHDDAGNAVTGRVVALDAASNVVVNVDADGLVALLGVSGLVVVRTPEATLVAPADQSERVKDVAGRVAQLHQSFA
ncbi:MAG: mannose-1-phosphate guanylyltransferase [Propionibacteriaceae bacterium]|jgi:mannose-1-phosphate guanylyltransferase|nr:mannose-1-phosphate guanylyltransferase [Propionibacteriaceae bacterium]